MKGKFRSILLGMAAILFSGSMLYGCNNDNGDSNSAVFRLTEKGARLANAAAADNKRKVAWYTEWKVYPKSFDISEAISSVDETYSAGDKIDSSENNNLNLQIPYSEILNTSIKSLFLIGNSNGGILKNNKIRMASDGTDDSAILYPSTENVEEELSSYDLNAGWPDESKTINEALFNQDQEAVVSYQLTDNSGTLTNKSYSTNLHFTVNLSNDQDVTGSIEDINFSYKVDTETLRSSIEERIKGSFTSQNALATLSVNLYTDETGEAQLSDNDLLALHENSISEKTYTYTIYFKVSDSDGNSTAILSTAIHLYDDVKPILKNKDGNEISELKLNDTPTSYTWVSNETIISGVKKLLDEKGIVAYDGYKGDVEMNIDILEGEDAGIHISLIDGAGNQNDYYDSSISFKSSKVSIENSKENPDPNGFYTDNNGKMKYEFSRADVTISCSENSCVILPENNDFTNLKCSRNKNTAFSEVIIDPNTVNMPYLPAKVDNDSNRLNIILAGNVNLYIFAYTSEVNLYISEYCATILIISYTDSLAAVNIYSSLNEDELEKQDILKLDDTVENPYDIKTPCSMSEFKEKFGY